MESTRNSRVAKSYATVSENKPKYSSHRQKAKILLTLRSPQVGRDLQQENFTSTANPYEVWEGVDPGSSPSDHSSALHAPELPWIIPAFPPGVQSLFQAMNLHFCYILLLVKQQQTVCWGVGVGKQKMQQEISAHFTTSGQ